MNIFGLIGSIVKPVTKVFQTDAKTKQIKVEGKHKIEQAKIDLEVAKLTAQSKKEARQYEGDMSYDMQVLKNRRETIADEVIIFGFCLILLLTFVPATQGAMGIGWKALDGAPWWFEFGIVGILVSTLGLKDVLRMFMGAAKNKFGGTKKDSGPFSEVK